MREFDYVIVGGGLTAASAVDGIREVDPSGSIAVFSEEADPPYHRPPLSKEFFQAEEAPRELLHVKPAGWFEGQTGLTLFPSTRVIGLDADGLRVDTDDGETTRGGRILLATGGRPRTLDIPGSDLDGVETLRTAGDAEILRTAARHATRVVLVGGGFIGMELASTLQKIDVDSIIVEMDARVWANVFPESLSSFLRHYFEERGVHFMMGSPVAAFEGDDHLSRVILDSGEEIASDLAIVGVGLVPADELAREAGLAVQNGIEVDAFGETTAAHVYAAGDVARYPDPVFGDRTRTEHWDHAKTHGKLVGRNMAGERESYDHLSYFFTHVFDLSINVFGKTANPDRVIVSGELDSGSSIVYCATEDRLAGIILMNANDAMDHARALLRERPSVKDLIERIDVDTPGELVG